MPIDYDFPKAFDDAYKEMAGQEGGYVNDPADSGGETYAGVSRNNFPHWEGWLLIDAAKREGHRSAKAIDTYFKGHAVMAGAIKQFYFNVFWKALPGLPDRLHAKLFNASVNVGLSQGVKLLQRALNTLQSTGLAIDGKLGPATLGSVNGLPEQTIIEVYKHQQAEFYKSIVARKPSQGKFLKGWLRRAEWEPACG